MVDCPVSGGPAGAEKGSVTTMLGGDKAIVDELHDWLLETFSGKAVNCGPIGSGMAVKAINNTLNMAHVLVAVEGLCALRNYGVEPDIALDVINASSGRSLATEVRVPTEVLTDNFGFGFALKLMAKDCRIGASLMEENFPKSTLLKEVSRLSNEAEKKEYCEGGDYTTVSKLLEESSGTNLQISKK
jgi:3-hydroxyisobutyrate dehydrogenase